VTSLFEIDAQRRSFSFEDDLPTLWLLSEQVTQKKREREWGRAKRTLHSLSL